MTKCTFCADNLDAGSPPSCVAACPNGAMQQRGFTDEQIFSMIETLVYG